MAGYPLQALLNLRLYREDAAKTEVTVQEKKLRQEKELLQKAKEEVSTYLVLMPEKVENEYASIMGKPCLLEDIELVKHKVALIEQGLVERQMAVAEEEQKVQECEKAVLLAKEKVAIARKEAAKIETHKGIWEEIQKKEAERQEDLEMEEFSGIKELD